MLEIDAPAIWVTSTTTSQALLVLLALPKPRQMWTRAKHAHAAMSLRSRLRKTITTNPSESRTFTETHGCRMFEICPDTDPDSIGWSTEKTLISYWDTNLDDCSALFSSYDCVADLEFTPIGTIPYLTAAPTSTGTQTPYNTGAAITSPISPTITFSQLSGPVFTITASSAKGGTVIAASGTAASATGSGGGSAATGKASSSSSSSSGSSSGAASLSALDSLGLVVVIGVLSLVGIP